MKKLLFMITAVAFLFTACEKDNQDDIIQSAPQDGATIEFKIDLTDFGYKNTVPLCDDELTMDYVKFTVLDSMQVTTTYKSMIYYVNDEMLTQVIKLPVGTYLLTSFVVYNDNGTPDDENDDLIVRAAPLPNSEYWDLMHFQLNLEFTVDAFYKKQYEIDVLCYEDLFYDEFGFTWFQFHDVRIEYQCIFGDICVDDFAAYDGSLYEQQMNGIQFDMPAIFEIHVFKVGEEEALRVFSNEGWLGEGQCLEVYWPNRLDLEEEFYFELWVLLPTSNGFEYVLMDTWTFMDGEGAMTGEDGVVDFVIGDCQIDDADYHLNYAPLGPVDLLIIHANAVEFMGDVLAKLTAFGEFNSIDTYDAKDATPTLEDFEGYETVLVWSNFVYYDKVALGNVLADYSDLGGGVTLMTFSWYNGFQLAGRFMTEAYGSIPFGDYNPYSPGSLGIVHNPTHPIMNGVTSFSTGNFRSGYTGPLNAGAELIASYDDGMVLAAIHDHGTSRTCDLGFYPPSSDAHVESWDASTDGDVFMFNCLMWTAGATSK